jgi:hypothetical protein
MPSRFELIGKSKATITAIEILSLKMGQVDVRPAVCISFKVPLPNARLTMLDASLRDFLYENNVGKSNTTATLEGVEVVSDKPNLTAAASALGALTWDYEQTGCALRIYNGATGAGDIKLGDGEVRKLKIDPKEGGTVDHYFQFYTADVDGDTIGELAVLKSLERDIELTAPEIISAQKDLDEEDETPEAALAKTQPAGPAADAWPFPTEDPAKKPTVTTRKTRAGATAH